MPNRKKPARKANVKLSNQVLRGRGDYTDADRKLLQKIDGKIPEVNLGNIGKTIGGKFGLGGLGESVGKGLSSLFGMGDYAVKTNTLMQVPNAHAASIPTFSKDGKRGIRVVEREYLGDVYSGPVLVNSSTSFNNQTYRLNPADPVTFPWLSRIASNFDQWEPNGIVFEFISTSSEFNGTSQALGTVILASEYDVSDPAYVNKVEMENSDYANSTKPSQTAMHGLECDPAERPTPILYTGDFPVGEHKFYDLCNFQIATQGMSVVNQNLGELWISYDISFFKKQVNPTNLIIPTWLYKSTSNLGTFATFGAGTITPGSDPKITFVDGVIPGQASTILFDPTRNTGSFLITVSCTGTGGVGASSPSTIAGVFGAVTGCSLTTSRITKDTGANGGYLAEAIYTINSVNATVKSALLAGSASSIYNNTTVLVTELRSGITYFL